jgi:hypothetical protein
MSVSLIELEASRRAPFRMVPRYRSIPWSNGLPSTPLAESHHGIRKHRRQVGRDCEESYRVQSTVPCGEKALGTYDMKCAIPACGLESLYFRSGSLHYVDCIDRLREDAGPAKRQLIWLCHECTALWLVETWRPPGEQLRRRPLPAETLKG